MMMMTIKRRYILAILDYYFSKITYLLLIMIVNLYIARVLQQSKY